MASICFSMFLVINSLTRSRLSKALWAVQNRGRYHEPLASRKTQDNAPMRFNYGCVRAETMLWWRNTLTWLAKASSTPTAQALQAISY